MRTAGKERYARVDGVLVWLDSYDDWWPVREDEFTVSFRAAVSPEQIREFVRTSGCRLIHVDNGVEDSEAARAAVLDTLPRVYSPDYLNVLIPRILHGTDYLIQLPEGADLLAKMNLFLKNPDVVEVLPSFESFD